MVTAAAHFSKPATVVVATDGQTFITQNTRVYDASAAERAILPPGAVAAEYTFITWFKYQPLADHSFTATFTPGSTVLTPGDASFILYKAHSASPSLDSLSRLTDRVTSYSATLPANEPYGYYLLAVTGDPDDVLVGYLSGGHTAKAANFGTHRSLYIRRKASKSRPGHWSLISVDAGGPDLTHQDGELKILRDGQWMAHVDKNAHQAQQLFLETRLGWNQALWFGVPGQQATTVYFPYEFDFPQMPVGTVVPYPRDAAWYVNQGYDYLINYNDPTDVPTFPDRGGGPIPGSANPTSFYGIYPYPFARSIVGVYGENDSHWLNMNVASHLTFDLSIIKPALTQYLPNFSISTISIRFTGAVVAYLPPLYNANYVDPLVPPGSGANYLTSMVETSGAMAVVRDPWPERIGADGNTDFFIDKVRNEWAVEPSFMTRDFSYLGQVTMGGTNPPWQPFAVDADEQNAPWFTGTTFAFNRPVRKAEFDAGLHLDFSLYVDSLGSFRNDVRGIQRLDAIIFTADVVVTGGA